MFDRLHAMGPMGVVRIALKRAFSDCTVAIDLDLLSAATVTGPSSCTRVSTART